MLDHIIIKVTDLKASKAFYSKALAPLGHKATPEYTWGTPKVTGVGFIGEYREFFIVQSTAVKTPTHFAFRVTTRAQVKAFYDTALAAGGRENASPALSPQYHANYYSACVSDPDGHNIEVVCHEAE